MVQKKSNQIELNDRFCDVLQRMEYSDASLFITGRAGTGKSTLLSHFCARTKKNPVVLAPTGVAALNVRGQTIHKFFHFYTDVTTDKIRRFKVRPRNPKLYKKLTTIIIDEISMVRADLLDCIDVFLRLYGPNEALPFGGVQMIFVGDLYQLPPVVSRESEAIFSDHYETPYFFSAHCLRDADFSIIELDTIYRQKEQDFVALLNRIRTDNATDSDIAHLNQRFLPEHQPDASRFFITLTTTNAKADEINASHLDALAGRVHTSHAVISGDFGREYYPTAPELHFKIGAQIMLTNNDSMGRWVNGSIGVITAIRRDEEEKAYVEVKLDDDGARVHVYPHAWEVFRYALEGGQLDAQAAGTFTQLPFRLAWAVTIHKSQGKTFDHVMIDVGSGTFAPGQMYVALSRCTTFEGMVLKTRIAQHHIRTDARIVSFLAAHPYAPSKATLAEGDAMLASDAPPMPEKPNAPDMLAKARATLRPLTEGRHPITGEALAKGDACHDPEIIGALIALLDASEGMAPPKASRRQPREGAPNHGKAWDDAERKRAATAYEAGTPLKEIAEKHGRTSGSIRGELIRQGLIEYESA